MKYNFIRETVKSIVELFVSGDFRLLWLNDVDQIITPEIIAEAVSGYGIMTSPPESAFDEIDVFQTDDPDEVRIDFDLWFDGAKSDLTLKCTIYSFKQKKYSIDDIKML